MRKLFIVALALIAMTATAQIKREGNTFSAPKTERVTATKCDTIDAYWEDEDGKYQIYMGRKGGLFYYKNEKKTYIPKAHALEIKRELGIATKED
jgi:hypothetical protein